MHFIHNSFFLTLLFFLFFFIFILFTNSSITFFRVLLTLLLVFIYTVFLCYAALDYFAAFLIAAEVPIVLISLLFFFSKNSLQVDTIFAISKFKNSPLHWFVFFCLFGGLLIGFFHLLSLDFTLEFSVSSSGTSLTSPLYDSCILFANVYDQILHELFFFSTRNDFYLLFVVYYNLNCFLTFVLGFLLFFVSSMCIFIFFSFKKVLKITKSSIKSGLFMRKQLFTKQAAFNSRLLFFKKKNL